MNSANASPNNQRSLFADIQTNVIELKNVQEWNKIEKLDLERRAIGFYLNEHPMDIYAEYLEGLNVVRSKDFKETDSSVKIAGILLSKKEKLSKNGQKYAFLTISDQDNSFEVTIFPETFARVKDLLVVGNSLLIDANIKIEADKPKILGNAVNSIEKIVEGEKIFIQLAEDADIDALYETLEQIPDGKNEISFIVQKQNGSKVEIATTYLKNMTIENRRLISSIKGASFFKI